ncbi:hypothetical protein TRAPUB_3936 [Trametes pubescens]|uniref:DUF6534 domain-containing protein n=1 Tax=Trametes pubescens TaxID=154538 RepID=A0A1M2VCF0_TRAPU|nr:hypothetical protein TRAPUB_3936 [Trametes pubescens]
MLVTFGFGVAATVEAFIRPTFADFEKVAWMTSAGFGVAAIVDTLLTGTLILALQKSRTGFKGTDSLIDVLIMYAVNTGLLTGGLMDRVPQDCFDTGTLNLSALKDYSGDSTSQTWSVPRPRRGSTQIRLPNVNVSALSTGTMLDIRVDTERAVHMDAESIELEHKGSQPK